MSQLYYRRGAAVWAVEIETQPRFRIVGDHRELFDGPYQPALDVHPSGEEFVMTKVGVWGGRIVLVQNFFEELKERVGN